MEERGMRSIRKIREEMYRAMYKHGWSQIVLADFCQISRREVTDILGGKKTKIYLSTVERIAEGLDMKVSDLIGR